MYNSLYVSEKVNNDICSEHNILNKKSPESINLRLT